MFKATLKQIFGRGSILVFNQLSVLLAIPILAARLDFLIFGQVAIGFVLVQLSWVVSDWGIQHYSIEQWPQLKTQLQKNIFTSNATYLKTIIAALFIGLILVIILLGVIDFPILFWICIIPSIVMGSIYPLWFYQVEKSPHEMIAITILSRCIYLLIIICVIHENESAIWAFLAQGINMSIVTIYAYLRMIYRYQFKLQNFQFCEWLNTLKKSFPFLINALTNNQINTFWGFGLSIFGGPVAMAIYNIGDQVYRAGGAITNIIAQAVRIHFQEKSLKLLKPPIFFFSSIFILIAMMVYIFADFTVMYFFSDSYLPAIKVIKVMIIAWAIHGIVKLLNYPVLSEVHGSEWVNKLTYFILCIHFIFFVIWINFSSDVFDMTLMFLGVIIFQLIIFNLKLFSNIRNK